MQWSFLSEPMEFRALRKRQTKNGDDFLILVVEDEEGYQNEISCRDPEMFPKCRSLRKGLNYQFPVTVVANAQWQFARLDNRGSIYFVDVDTGESSAM